MQRVVFLWYFQILTQHYLSELQHPLIIIALLLRQTCKFQRNGNARGILSRTLLNDTSLGVKRLISNAKLYVGRNFAFWEIIDPFPNPLVFISSIPFIESRLLKQWWNIFVACVVSFKEGSSFLLIFNISLVLAKHHINVVNMASPCFLVTLFRRFQYKRN